MSFLTAFDSPSGELNCDRRQTSTAAPQALMLMNSDFVLSEAANFAKRVVHEIPAVNWLTPADVEKRRIQRAWQIAYQRDAEPDELLAARNFLAQQCVQFANAKLNPEVSSLTDLCQQLLSSNEFPM